MNLAQRFYAPTEKFPPYDTIGNTTASGDPNLADAWVAFDYGDGGIVDGELQPGAANLAIAQYLVENVITVNEDEATGEKRYDFKAPITAQVLVGKAIMALCEGIEESDAFRVIGKPRTDGKYVDSWKVAIEARENIPWARIGPKELTENQRARLSRGLPAGRLAVAAVPQHGDRATWQTQRAFGRTVEAYKAAGIQKTYAPDSTQIWTKNAFIWKPWDLLARGLAYVNGGEPSVGSILAVPGLLAAAFAKKIGL